jgi:hypothetical protein
LLKTRNLLIFRDAQNAANRKIAANWNVSGTRGFFLFFSIEKLGGGLSGHELCLALLIVLDAISEVAVVITNRQVDRNTWDEDSSRA